MKIKHFPAAHAYLSGLLVLLIVATALVNRGAPERSERLTTDAILEGVAEDLSALDPATHAVTPGTTPASPAAQPESSADVERVRPGDNLSVVFQRRGIPARDLQQILDSGPLASRLDRLRPGDALTFARDADGTLLRFAYAANSYERLEFERVGDRYVGQEIVEPTEVVRVHRDATIDQSLFDTGLGIGLDDRVTLKLANIFRWDIDFVQDIRDGDRFQVVFEERRHNGKPVKLGDILAAEFVNRGRHYRAVRYVDPDGRADFYSPEGAAMRKQFLRAPFNFSPRISSRFNLKRRHPLFGRTMPHRGIDYAAPVGTPVLATGDGTVEVASRNRANGNYIVLRHGGQFRTKYLHLSRFHRNTRRGRAVSQGDTIGYVGATGYATGPHLHYEFLVDGVHRNPRTVELPKALPIPAAERQRFGERTAPLLALLDRDTSHLAAAL